MSQQIHARRITIGREQDELAWRHAIDLLRAGAVMVLAIAASAARAWG
ncbi:MAG: hypothetical protein KF903_08920 [Dokdonella sp.]|nr:hypothetical protein [Dokdonella sp.]MBX3701102.1 hypothetical protein [Dokdonella sp.]